MIWHSRRNQVPKHLPVIVTAPPAFEGVVDTVKLLYYYTKKFGYLIY